jgi:hypothetical protein
MIPADPGPGAPPALRPLLAAILDALRALEAPAAPLPAATCLRADRPPAGAWPWHLILVRDLGVLAHSDGVRWIRHDTGKEV